MTVLFLFVAFTLVGCEREPRVSAGSNGTSTSIEERYGLADSYWDRSLNETVIPVRLADGRMAQLIIPKGQTSGNRVLLRDGTELYPVELQNPAVSRDRFVRSEPRVIARRVEQPTTSSRSLVTPKKTRSTKDEVLIIAGSTGAGAAIGALAGGKKGAAVGALSGGVAGLVYDLATRKKWRFHIQGAFMKFITVCVLSLFLAMTACDRGVSTRAASDSGISDEERDRYEDRVAARLKEFDLRFDGLDARLKGLDEASQDQLRVDIDELRVRRELAERKFSDLRKVSEGSWLDLKSSLDQELDQLDLAYNVVAANNHGID
jgi:hypothetical protein